MDLPLSTSRAAKISLRIRSAGIQSKITLFLKSRMKHGRSTRSKTSFRSASMSSPQHNVRILPCNGLRNTILINPPRPFYDSQFFIIKVKLLFLQRSNRNSSISIIQLYSIRASAGQPKPFNNIFIGSDSPLMWKNIVMLATSVNITKTHPTSRHPSHENS
jgi:hypothetical protein